MSQDEIAVMDGSKCIMQLRGVRPFFSDKFDITKHKQYPLLSDYDKKNEFDIEKYVKNRNRLRFKRNDVVDEVCDVGEIFATMSSDELKKRQAPSKKNFFHSTCLSLLYYRYKSSYLNTYKLFFKISNTSS